MRRSQRLIAAAVLDRASRGALAGCGSGGLASFDPSDHARLPRHQEEAAAASASRCSPKACRASSRACRRISTRAPQQEQPTSRTRRLPLRASAGRSRRNRRRARAKSSRRAGRRPPAAAASRHARRRAEEEAPPAPRRRRRSRSQDRAPPHHRAAARSAGAAAARRQPAQTTQQQFGGAFPCSRCRAAVSTRCHSISSFVD